MIISTGNSQVKQVSALVKKAKVRNERGVFVIEGKKMFAEVPPDRVEKVYVSESFLKDSGNAAMVKAFSCETVSDEVLKAMADTQTPQGILAIAKQYTYRLEDLLNQKKSAHFLILETIQDPGNLGTILRAGEGAGITGIIMDRSTVDIYNPKVIRSTMGSVYRVPFVYTENLRQTLEILQQKKIKLFAAHLKGKNNYEEEDYTGNIGFLIGNEANGLSAEITAMADCFVKIPMAGKVESLNAAVAASILMFEAVRQRRSK